MAHRRRNPVGRVGGYAAEVDTTGMDPADIAQLIGTPMTKLEEDYVKGTGRASSKEAVRRARRANRKPPVKE